MERKKEILISGSQLAVILCICRLPEHRYGSRLLFLLQQCACLPVKGLQLFCRLIR